jgi:hypothetical protein
MTSPSILLRNCEGVMPYFFRKLNMNADAIVEPAIESDLLHGIAPDDQALVRGVQAGIDD